MEYIYTIYKENRLKLREFELLFSLHILPFI